MAVPEDKYWVGIMIDLESLDTEPSSCLLSGAYVIFTKDTILEENYSEFDTIPQLLNGRTSSPATVAWWKRTNEDELERLLREGKNSVGDFILQLREAMRDFNVTSVWSRGDYDRRVIEDIVGKKPWPYYMERDVRTLDEFTKKKPNGHNALQDCLDQVEQVQLVLPKEII